MGVIGMQPATDQIATRVSVEKHSHTEPRRHGGEEINETEIGGIVVDCAVKVHMRLDPGLLESVY